MLKITTKEVSGEKETFDIATEFHEMMKRSSKHGTRVSPFGWRVGQMKDAKSAVHLHADSDVGNALLRLLDDGESLYDLCIIDEGVSHIREELKDEIEQNLLYEQYHTVDELFDDIKAHTKELATSKMSFYCPLTAYINDHDNEYRDADSQDLVDNQELIASAIADEQVRELNMATYVSEHAALGEKLVFIEWNVEERQGALYGRIDCYLSEELSEDEIGRLKDAIEGQNSDGLGEGFEQKEIYIDDGDLYVSYWHSGDNYFLYDDAEMEEHLSHTKGMSMGG